MAGGEWRAWSVTWGYRRTGRDGRSAGGEGDWGVYGEGATAGTSLGLGGALH